MAGRQRVRTGGPYNDRAALRAVVTRGLIWLVVLMLSRPPFALAQEEAVEATLVGASPTAATQRLFSQQELDQILAPIALYPDALLAQLLMASTYPLEVVQAARWIKAHPNLKGEELQAALQQEAWDPSVKGLTSVPQVLAMMDEKLDWTQKLGDAFLSQQQAVMDTIQSLRARAQAAGNLVATPQQTVLTQGQQISIAPASPGVIYVPVYDPALVYGAWWWPAPPYYWYPPGYVGYGPYLYFGIGFIVGTAIWGACDWGHHAVVVNVPHYNVYNHARREDARWSHAVEHRHGVPYRDDATRAHFGRALPGAEFRRDFRGYEHEERHQAIQRPSTVPIQPQHPRPSAVPVPSQPPRPSGQQPAGAARSERAVPPAAVQRVPPPSPQPSGPPPASPRVVPSMPEHRAPATTTEHAPPVFESFGHGGAAQEHSHRGAASREVPHSAPSGGIPARHR